MHEPELIIAPAEKGPWGVVALNGGPPDLAPCGDEWNHALRAPNGLLREGMIALIKRAPHDPVHAEHCFRAALELLIPIVGPHHPKVMYALDRIGLTCQMRGRYQEAEELYVRSLVALDVGKAAPSAWNEVTFLNLAILYGCQGRDEEREAVLERLREIQKLDS